MTDRNICTGFIFCLAVAGSAACSGSDSGGSNPDVGGSPSNGGSSALPTGGTSSAGVTGGSSTVTVGGSSVVSSGGSSVVGGTAGGSASTGGATSVAGSPSTGGAPATGGMPTTGGSRSAGGASATGGAPAVGGSAAAGGTKATGGVTSTGGAPATGGAPVTGGSKATGGLPATGGAPATGGSKATGGAATGGAPSTGGSAATCTVPPATPALVGWASVSGTIGGTTVATTTGGGNATPVTVTTLAQLQSAVQGTTPAVIYVKGVLAAGSIAIGSNKTIAGICGAEIHGHLGLSSSSNVIVRNIKIVGNNCTDSPSQCSSGADAVTIVTSAHHIWFDHCDISDGSDGNLDITNGSDFVTVSYTKFSYSTARTDPVAGTSGHRFSNLIGAADTVAEDVGHLNVTYHHCWWAQNVDQRMPRTRRGKIHVFNNLFTAAGNSYCTNAGFEATLLVENNIYNGVNNPLAPDANATGMQATGNVFTNTTGTTTAPGGGFTPPYTYSLDSTSGLQATLQTAVGPK
jgi:pectate lyase